MPRKAKSPPVETKSTTAASGAARGTKTAAVRVVVSANPNKLPKELAKLLQTQGWDVKASFISVVKSNMRGAKKLPATPAAAVAVAAPTDIVSLGLLQKAKKLALQFGSIHEAKDALDALSQLMD